MTLFSYQIFFHVVINESHDVVPTAALEAHGNSVFVNSRLARIQVLETAETAKEEAL